MKQENKDIVVQENKNELIIEKEFNIDGYLEKRSEFIEKVNKIMVEGKDYHIIKNKKSMAKGGAEKIASIFGWRARFTKSNESLEMLGDITGCVAYICTLKKGNTFMGEGRGASMLSKNDNDPNKTLKMAQKSAFIDAVLRSSGLSDFYTQDLEDMDQSQITNTYKVDKDVKAPAQNYGYSKLASDKQVSYIESLVYQKEVPPDLLKKIGKNKDTYTIAIAGEVIDYLTKLPNRPKTNSAPAKQEEPTGEWNKWEKTKHDSPENEPQNDIPTIDVDEEIDINKLNEEIPF